MKTNHFAPFGKAAAVAALFLCAAATPASALLSLTGPYTQSFVRLEAEDGTLSDNVSVITDNSHASRGGLVFIENAGSSITLNTTLDEGYYRVTIGYNGPYGDKVANVSINGNLQEVTLPGRGFISSVNIGQMQLAGDVTVQITDNWTWFEIDWIQFVRVDETANDMGQTRKEKLMDYMLANRGTSMLSGQQDDEDASYILGNTGLAPAIINEDMNYYGSVSLDNYGNPGQQTEDMIKLWENGYAVSLCWHWLSPSGYTVDDGTDYWWNSFYSEHTTFDLAAALADKEGSDYQLLMADIDRIGNELEKFAMADIPVLWRPLHEAEGNQWGAWFWWGNSGADAFKELWAIMYNRLVNERGLKNLIWVYTCTDLISADWYPGNDYVDIIGIDQYPTDRTSTLESAWNTLNTTFGDTGKPFALTEFGGVPDVEAMLNAGVNWLYFASWENETNGPESVDTETLTSIYSSSRVITVDEFDQNVDGFTNGACSHLQAPLQVKLRPAMGLGSAGDNVELSFYDDAWDYDFDLTYRDFLKVNRDSDTLEMGDGHILLKSTDMQSWSVESPASFELGEDDQVLIVVPVDADTPQFFRLSNAAG